MCVCFHFRGDSHEGVLKFSFARDVQLILWTLLKPISKSHIGFCSKCTPHFTECIIYYHFNARQRVHPFDHPFIPQLWVTTHGSIQVLLVFCQNNWRLVVSYFLPVQYNKANFSIIRGDEKDFSLWLRMDLNNLEVMVYLIKRFILYCCSFCLACRGLWIDLNSLEVIALFNKEIHTIILLPILFGINLEHCT